MKFVIQKVRIDRGDYPIIDEVEFQANSADAPMNQVFAAIDHGYSKWGADVPRYFRTVETLGNVIWGADLCDGMHVIEVQVKKEPRAIPMEIALVDELEKIGTASENLDKTLTMIAEVYKSSEQKRSIEAVRGMLTYVP